MKDYSQIMNKYVVGKPGLNEAQKQTKSYKHRHITMKSKLGIWRWRGLYDNRHRILPLLEGAESIIDVGGGACSVGYGAKVIDRFDTWPEHGTVDLLFTSHTFEHVAGLEYMWDLVLKTLTEDGHFIVHVPAYTATRWNAGIAERVDKDWNPHVWNFCLKDDEDKCPIPFYSIPFDGNVETIFCEYVADNSILWIGKKTKV